MLSMTQAELDTYAIGGGIIALVLFVLACGVLVLYEWIDE